MMISKISGKGVFMSVALLGVSILSALVIIFTFLSQSMCGCYPTTIIQLDTEQDGDDYNLTVIKISSDHSLETFQYILRDNNGLSEQFGEIALSNFSGQWHGIDVTWDDNGNYDTSPGNNGSDRAETAGGFYGGRYEAQVRIDAVQKGFQPLTPENEQSQRCEGAISVSFIDYDLDGNLSAGDVFTIKTYQEYHDADENWTLTILYHPNDRRTAIFRLDEPESPNPVVVLDSSRDSNDDYRVHVIKANPSVRIDDFQYYLKDVSGLTKQFCEIALQNISGDWHGVDVTWDDDGSADPNSNGKADRSDDAGGPYTDTTQAQTRIDAVQAGTQGTTDNQKSEGTISVSFTDNDYNGKLTSGDLFLVQGNDATHTANDDYHLVLRFDITDDVVASERLGS